MAAMSSCRARFLGTNVYNLIDSKQISSCACLREKIKTKKSSSFSDTCLLPKTDFPLRVASHTRAHRDAWIQKKCHFDQLYDWQRQQLNRPEFILHDGPPYANGKPHMGHAVNKVFKDITVRYNVLNGHRVHYKPGWDCHGLPIELKASTGNTLNQSVLDIQNAAQEVVQEAVKVQKTAFKRWGVLADWQEPYFTHNINYIKSQLDAFCTLHEKGYVFRKVKPVYWSPSSRTALAEAELEYNPVHQSEAIYLAFPLTGMPQHVAKNLPKSARVYALVWTTTPWTIPANEAICINSKENYCLIQIGDPNEWFLVAEKLFGELEIQLGKHVQKKLVLAGLELLGLTYKHPLNKRVLPILPGSHVTMHKGTGLVHTAPAHGPEDYLVALENNISVECLVDEQGCFMPSSGPHLNGLFVLTDGNQKVIELLGPAVLHQEKLTHSYPYDWRTKQPVILRASMQWFVDTNRIKELALECLREVTIVPQNFQNGMVAQLEKRPYWCISRQRKWGVPIPALYRKGSDEPIVSRSFISHLSKIMDKEGMESWWTQSVENLANKELLDELKLSVDDLEKGSDIMDIWFDSGISWASVLGADKVADVYLEGHDQFTGWFQSSLLLSVALRGISPYKTLFIHGFTVDEKGRKMSKSLGNVVDPTDITDGSDTVPAYGADVLRWWVASHALGHSLIPVTSSTLRSSADSVHKIRIVLRFILGGLNGFSRSAGLEKLLPLDQYMQYLIHCFSQQINNLYKDFQYKKVCSILLNFVTNEVSAFYCHLIKDRLYCEAADSPARLSCQTTLFQLLDALIKSAAPIMPHLAEEVALYDPTQEWCSAFKRNEILMAASLVKEPSLLDEVTKGLTIRDAINLQMTGRNLRELDAVICADDEVLQKLKVLHPGESKYFSQLCEMLQVSGITLALRGHEIEDEDPNSVIQVVQEDATVLLIPAKGKLCKRCRQYTVLSNHIICQRCTDVLAAAFSK